MGKVAVSARIENVYDLHEVSLGTRPVDAVRAVDIADALVDTGASTLSLPKRMITQLGLQFLRTRQARQQGRREFKFTARCVSLSRAAIAPATWRRLLTTAPSSWAKSLWS